MNPSPSRYVLSIISTEYIRFASSIPAPHTPKPMPIRPPCPRIFGHVRSIDSSSQERFVQLLIIFLMSLERSVLELAQLHLFAGVQQHRTGPIRSPYDNGEWLEIPTSSVTGFCCEIEVLECIRSNFRRGRTSTCRSLQF